MDMNSTDFKGEFTHSYAKKTRGRMGAYDAKDFLPPTKKEILNLEASQFNFSVQFFFFLNKS